MDPLHGAKTIIADLERSLFELETKGGLPSVAVELLDLVTEIRTALSSAGLKKQNSLSSPAIGRDGT